MDESPASDQSATTQLSETLVKGGFKLVKTYSVGETQAFLAVRENTESSGREQTGITVLSFRGTDQKVADWKTNLTAYKQIVDGVPIHSGFLMAFRLVRAEIAAYIKRFSEEGHSLYLTGHSLGGGLALIAT